MTIWPCQIFFIQHYSDSEQGWTQKGGDADSDSSGTEYEDVEAEREEREAVVAGDDAGELLYEDLEAFRSAFFLFFFI